MQDQIDRPEPVDGAGLRFELALELGDRLRGHPLGQGARLRARRPRHAQSRCRRRSRPLRGGAQPVRARGADGEGAASTQVILSQRGEIEDRQGRLPARARRRARAGSSARHPRLDRRRRGRAAHGRAALRRGADARARVARGLAAARAAGARGLGPARPRRSSSRSPTSPRCGCAATGGTGRMPAAGMPWFMTVFGRDTMITCLQTLLFGPELARTALEVLAELQARDDNPTSTPSRARSSTSCAPARPRRTGSARYYGTVDATPLFLVLLSEVWRWTDDAALRARAEGAGAGRAALDRRVRRPRRRRLRRVRAAHPARAREPVVEGLVRLAALPRRVARQRRRSRPSRCRATSTTRSCRTAELAREVWRDRHARRAARARGGGAEASASTSVLDRRARRLLRARARRREAAGRLALLEHRPPALERDRPERAGRRGRRPADGRGALVGLGRADDVERRRGLQPALVPQRHRLAPRQLPDRARASRCTPAGPRRSGSSAGC